jgi:hypothetical protein
MRPSAARPSSRAPFVRHVSKSPSRPGSSGVGNQGSQRTLGRVSSEIGPRCRWGAQRLSGASVGQQQALVRQASSMLAQQRWRATFPSGPFPRALCCSCAPGSCCSLKRQKDRRRRYASVFSSRWSGLQAQVYPGPSAVLGRDPVTFERCRPFVSPALDFGGILLDD